MDGWKGCEGRIRIWIRTPGVREKHSQGMRCFFLSGWLPRVLIAFAIARRLLPILMPTSLPLAHLLAMSGYFSASILASTKSGNASSASCAASDFFDEPLPDDEEDDDGESSLKGSTGLRSMVESWLAAFSNSGVIFLQWAHQGAKNMTRRSPGAATAESKVWSVSRRTVGAAFPGEASSASSVAAAASHSECLAIRSTCASLFVWLLLFLTLFSVEACPLPSLSPDYWAYLTRYGFIKASL